MSHTANCSVQYVTAYYNIRSQAMDTLFSHFKPFLNTTLPILLFTDEEQLPSEVVNHPNIQIVNLPRKELVAFQFQSAEPAVELPVNRSPEKDTLGFLMLMNAKPELLQRAAQLQKADAYVWFDLGILKISKHHDRFLKLMSQFNESVTMHPKKIIMPGCISKDSVRASHMFATPIWRFCGGIFIAPSAILETFVEEHKKQLQLCKEKNALTWEVNLFANMEIDHPEMFQWYVADHNDSIVDAPVFPKQKRLILLTMIKNENKIIKRMIESALPAVDAVCVCDTGSTDNTIEVLTEYFNDFKVPAKIFNGPEHLWKNFGYNRSQSFLSAVKFCDELGWDAEHTYAVALDADMQLVVKPAFNKAKLTAIGYKMIQKSHALEYYNTRFLKIGHPWKCVGVTHEYWDGGQTDTITMDEMYISDIGDGGCKDDKFERDVRLLEQGLVESPNNPRYLFYLAQSYKDNKQLDKSIELYKKRIEVGGWYEEIWYSMYAIMKLYAEKGDVAQAEMWGQKAYEFHNKRAENLLFLCRLFKDKRQYYKAWHYYQLGSAIPKPNDMLFIETDCYDRNFDFERTIIHDYVFPHKKRESIDYSMNYYNKWHEHCCYTNLQWFVQRIPCKTRQLQFHDIGDFVATSTCILKQKDDMYRLNVRYVNYRIQPNGGYLMMENGVISGDHAVRTENYTCLMDSEFNILSALKKMEPGFSPLHHPRIKGMEDVRIFYDSKGRLRYTGTSMEYSYNGKIRQVTGDYNPDTGKLETLEQLKPPTESDCEKNWIPYKNDQYIYSWHPFWIGKPNEEGRLEINVKQDTPKFLSHMRGSSPLVRDGDYYYGITHCVMYQTPRKYYHMVVKIDARSDRLVGYTDPFFFVNNAIEYALGYEKIGDRHIAIVSQNDRHPVMCEFKDADLRWRGI